MNTVQRAIKATQHGILVILLLGLYFSSLIATIAAGWMIFGNPDPKITSGAFKTAYHAWYLPSLWYCCVVYVIYAAAGDDVERESYTRRINLQIMLPAAMGSFACWEYATAYVWPFVVLVALVTHQAYLSFKPTRQRSVVPINGAQESAKATNQSDIRFPAVAPKANYSSIMGMNEVKARMFEAAREVVARQKDHQEARNGILLYGEPGNGKTFFAEALAGELKLPIMKASYGDVVSKWVGETSENVERLFVDAVAQAPCVLFIDEIDSLIRDRGAAMSGGNAEEAKTTNVLLTGLVEIRAYGVVVVAATNFVEKLDGAAIREGRFDFKVEITPPDADARIGLIRSVAKKHKTVRLAESAVAQASKRWEGFSVARVRAVVEEACRTAAKGSKATVEYADLRQALRAVQGISGDRIPADTPELNSLIMPADQLNKLKGIAHRMRNVEEIEDMGGSVPTGLLFWGPPGTGKTLTVRSLAKTTEWALKTVNGSELMADPNKVDELVSFAKTNRPCIIFIDEADDVLGHRGMSGYSATALTNKLLTAVDGSKGKTPDVLWVAATNHPDGIDEAAMRGGRFTEKIGFGAPDTNTIERLVAEWLGTTKAPVSVEVTPTAVAEILDGESPANIKAIMQQAANIMIDRKIAAGVPTKVMLADVQDALATVTGS